MKKKLTIITLALMTMICIAGCGKKESSQENGKTYDYSTQYATAVEQLDNCIIDDEAYATLQEELDAYQDKDLTALSKTDAKALKAVLQDISEYYEASAQTIQDTLVQIGQIYPTEDGFYDDEFITSTSALFQELNTLRDEGRYKEAAAKLNQITAAYTAYVESKGQTISAEVTVDASKTAAVKQSIAKASGNNAGTSKNSQATAGATTGNTGNTASAASGTNNATGNTGNTGNTAPAASGTNNATGSTGNTSSNTNISHAGSGNNNSNNTASSPERKTWTYTCPECGWTITAYEGDADANLQVNQHDDMHVNEEAEAFAYVTAANNAMIAWERENGTAITDQDAWLREHGYDPALIDSYCAKYGW